MLSPDNISTFVFFTLILRKSLASCYDYWKTLYSLQVCSLSGQAH